MNPESRETYRVAPSDEDALSARLELADGRHVGLEILDLSSGGIGGRVSAPLDPGLCLDQAVTVRLLWSRQREPLRFEARVRSREDGRRSQRYGLRFSDPAQLEEALDGPLARLLNRRKIPRVAPAEGEPVRTLVRVPDGPEARAELVNVSPAGAAVRIDAATELHGAEWLEVVLHLPGMPPTEAPVELVARVRHRRRLGPALHLNLEFDGDAGPGLDAARARVTEYVLRHQGAERRAA